MFENIAMASHYCLMSIVYYMYTLEDTIKKIKIQIRKL